MSVHEVRETEKEPRELTNMELWGEEDIKPQTPEEREKLEKQGQMRLKWDS